MSATSDELLKRKRSKLPFTIYRSEGRCLQVPTGNHIGLHPSGRGTSVTVYGPGEDEQHRVPIVAIASLSPP